MRYGSPDAFRDALEDRLRAEARESGVALMRLRKRVAFERFLARLAAAAPRGWMLKGAFALDLRLGLRARTTKDVDLGRPDAEEQATADLAAAASVDLGDFFTFAVRRTPGLDQAAEFQAVRYTVASELAGRRFEQFPIDVALGQAPVLAPERLRSPDLLGFAGIEGTELPVVALEQHVAEKLHAYTGTYGQRGEPSTRSKDLVDLLLIAELAEIDARRLRQALESTFEVRAQQPLPEALPPPPPAWAASYRRQADEVGLGADLDSAHTEASAFLDPVLSGAAGGRWEPGRKRWGGER